MARRFTPVALFIFIYAAVAARAELRRNIDGVVIDGETIPFGAIVEISGRCASTDSFELEIAAASVRASLINGKATQEDLDFQLMANQVNGDDSYEQLQSLKEGAYYQVRGRLTDARFSSATKACALVVESFAPTPPKTLGFADFLDREMQFDGVAASGGKLNVGKEVAKVAGLTAWPSDIVGKSVMIRGVLRRNAAEWRIDQPVWQLIKLDDQLDKQVSLEGRLWSHNGEWWFDYRDEKLYLVSSEGPVLRFDGNDHGRAVRVAGKLVRQERPSIDQISEKTDRDLVQCFVVRAAKVEYLDAQQSWGQRFGTIYPSFHTIKDGVPDLLPELSFRRNIMEHDTTAGLYLERNHEVIDAILRDATPQTKNVLAKRLDDAALAEPVRLLYAAMLARLNDLRGRSFFEKMLDPAGRDVNPDVLYCLGVFPFLGLSALEVKADLNWAEKSLTELLANKQKAHFVRKVVWEPAVKNPMTVAEAVVQFSDIPLTLTRANSAAARKALVDYAIDNGDDPASTSKVIDALGGFRTPLPVEDLARLEAMTARMPPEDQRTYDFTARRRAVLAQALRQKATTIVPKFFFDLEDSFVYMDFRDQSSPEVLAELRSHVDDLSGQAKVHAQMLLLLGERDPVPRLLSILNDPQWADKNLILFELARIGDPRAVVAVADFLRDSPREVLPADASLENAAAVEHALDAIAHAGTSEAVKALIELLSVDLGRFDSYIDREGFRRIVAAHLIELTGESFGIDEDAWQNWRADHPSYSLNRDLANPGSPFRENAGQAIDLGR